VSGPLPGAVHDKKAEWVWGVLAELEAAGLVVLADKGYPGSTYAKIPYRGKNKPQSQKDANRAHAKLRAPGERANAPAQGVEDPPETPLLPLESRPACQGHPRTADPRGITGMERVLCWQERPGCFLLPASPPGVRGNDTDPGHHQNKPERYPRQVLDSPPEPRLKPRAIAPGHGTGLVTRVMLFVGLQWVVAPAYQGLPCPIPQRIERVNAGHEALAVAIPAPAIAARSRPCVHP
jgi:hypothetical protein